MASQHRTIDSPRVIIVYQSNYVSRRLPHQMVLLFLAHHYESVKVGEFHACS